MGQKGDFSFMAQSQDSSSLLDISGLTNIAGSKVAIVYTEWNDKIVDEQIAGAQRILDKAGITEVSYYPVPGSFELPFACKQVSDLADVVIAFGAVIRGGTPHFEYVCKAVTEGITQLNVTINTPVIFGVLTLDNEQQAWERLGGVHGHKGEEAAITALKMVQFYNTVQR